MIFYWKQIPIVFGPNRKRARIPKTLTFYSRNLKKKKKHSKRAPSLLKKMQQPIGRLFSFVLIFFLFFYIADLLENWKLETRDLFFIYTYYIGIYWEYILYIYQNLQYITQARFSDLCNLKCLYYDKQIVYIYIYIHRCINNLFYVMYLYSLYIGCWVSV